MSELKMKTVSGKVVSTTSVSLSKAAKILSNFTSSDNGASPAFAAYLRRASASFGELAQLHKKYKGSGVKHNVKKQRSESIVSEGTVHSVIGVERKERRGVKEGEGEDGRISVDEERRRKSEKRSEDGRISVDEEKRHKSEKRSEDEAGRDAGRSVMRREGEVGEENGDGNVAGAGVGKKSKKKGRNNEVEAVTTNDQREGDHDVIDVKVLKNTESFDGSKETKKKKREKHGREKPDEIESLDVSREIRSKKKNDMREKEKSADATAVENGTESLDVSSERRSKKKNDNKHEKANVLSAIDAKNEIGSFDVSKERRSKNKNDKHEKERSDYPVDVKKEMQSHPSSENGNGEAIQIVEDGNEQKQRKKHKKKKEARIDEQRNENKGDHGGETDHVDKGGVEKKHKKKRSHAGEEKENEGKLDSEGAIDKESRKRKHESAGTEEFESSQEQHKSKKKKR